MVLSCHVLGDFQFGSGTRRDGRVRREASETVASVYMKQMMGRTKNKIKQWMENIGFWFE